MGRHGLVAAMLPVSAAYSVGFMGPEPGALEGDVPIDKKDRGITQVLERMWGTATWPPKGKGPNPGDKNFTGAEIEPHKSLFDDL